MDKKEELKQQFEEVFDDTEKKEEAARALTTQTDAALAAWGDREAVIATGIRIKTMLPGGDKLTIPHALAAGQYAVATGLNPFRGEFYAYTDKKGNLSIVDGYKALTRWANDECPYDEQFRPLKPEEGEAHRIKCIIMRHDRRQQLDYYLEKGADFETAFGLVTKSAVGVVKTSETRWPDGNPKDPPQGWTWEQVAEKRALKNALNFSHGMPTVAELARKSWEVAGILTKPEDWEGTEDLKSQDERERYAEMSARTRGVQEAFRQLSPEEQQAKLADNDRLLHGDHDEDDPFGEMTAERTESGTYVVTHTTSPRFQEGDTISLVGLDGEDIHGPAIDEPEEEPPQVDDHKDRSTDHKKEKMSLGSALGTALNAAAPGYGLVKGDYLLKAVAKDAKDLIEYLTKASSYKEPSFENLQLQEAAQVIFDNWEDARRSVLKEEVKEVHAPVGEGGTPPLF